MAFAVAERSLPLEGAISADGTSVTLSWKQTEPNGPDPVTVNRRVLGQEGRGTWQFLATVSGSPTSTYTDTTTVAGVAYEYEVYRNSRFVASDTVDRAGGYLTVGREARPEQENRGILLLVVDDTVAPQLAGELRRLETDLVGDGWQVVRHDSPRDNNATSGRAQELRAWVQSEYAKNPTTPHTLFLFGRLPIVTSGSSAPDGHDPSPHATDLYYADIDGIWKDSANLSRNPPGDGQFDHNYIASSVPSVSTFTRNDTTTIEMGVGRVDLSSMPAFSRNEVTLLRDYLAKDHAFRNVGYTTPTRSYWDKMAFDESFTEQYGAIDISGKANTITGEHLGTGQESPAIWGVDFSDHNGANYPNYDIKAVFAINFGSGKQRWNSTNNPMRAMLAQPWYNLTCAWGVRPNWYIHHMAMGETIGNSHFRTANNRFGGSPSVLDYVVSDDYSDSMRQSVWIDLMGDPTLRAQPVAPASDLVAVDGGTSVDLTWVASPASGVTGYKLYRATEKLGPYLPLNGGNLVSGTAFTDPSPLPGAYYMVRAQRLETVPSGSFYNLSQGAFATTANSAPVVTSPVLTTRSGFPIAITLSASDADSDPLTYSRSSLPAHGTISGDAGSLVYIPAEGFSGQDSFNFSVSDGTSVTSGMVTVQVQPPSILPSVTSPASVTESLAGNQVILAVDVQGDQPLTYRWFKGETAVSPPTVISGVTDPDVRLVLRSAVATDSGEYHVELTNPVGAVSNIGTPLTLRVFEEKMSDSLVLHYRFDEGTGNVIKDTSPSGNDHSANVSGAIWNDSGKIGGSSGPVVLTDSFKDFLVPNAEDINFHPRKNSYTFSIWFRTTNTGNFSGLFEKRDGSGVQFRAWITDDQKIEVYNGNSRSTVTIPVENPPKNGEWHLLTFVNYNLSGTWKTRIYYDDGTVSSEFDSGNTQGAGDFFVGKNNRWRGQLDDFRVYRRALTQPQVASLFATTTPPTITYEEWAAATDWQGADSSPTGDANHNGISNEIEFLLGRSGAGDPQPLFSKMEAVTEAAGNFYVLEYRRKTEAPGMVASVSHDLIDWSRILVDGVNVIEEIVTADPLGNGTVEDVRLRIKITAVPTPACFVRFTEGR